MLFGFSLRLGCFCGRSAGRGSCRRAVWRFLFSDSGAVWRVAPLDVALRLNADQSSSFSVARAVSLTPSSSTESGRAPSTVALSFTSEFLLAVE